LSRGSKSDSQRVREKKENLYNKIKNLPFSENVEDFEEDMEKILDSSLINDDLTLYLEEKYSYRER